MGAGPAGQLLGLLLARQNIPVTIVEQAPKLDDRPRATHYGPPAVRILNRAGVGDDLRAKGFVPDGVVWRRLDGSVIAGIKHEAQGDSDDRMVALPLNELGEILYEHGKNFPHLKFLFNHRVVGVGQNSAMAWVNTVDTNTGEQASFEADYIVGCDGANSVVRRSLFGDREFPGRTWDEQLVATNVSPDYCRHMYLALILNHMQVYYNFESFGSHDSNFIIDPEHWYMAAKITKDGMWRVTYGEDTGLTADEVIARQPQRFKEMLPGNPDTSQYNLMNISPYRVHQRLAEKMRVGRFVLAADAAHLCNPM